MIIQVLVEGRIVQQDDLDYFRIPSSDVIQRHSEAFNIDKLRSAGIDANICVVLPSIMNNPIWRKQHENDTL